MKILELDSLTPGEREFWVSRMEKTDWDAGGWLADLAGKDKIESTFGVGSKVLILTDDENLVSFCTLAVQDEIDDMSMTPWIGFVYTFPQYRGKRCSGKLIEYAISLAAEQGNKKVYVSSEEIGLYEKYGFTYLKTADSVHGYKTRIYVREI